MVLNNKETSPNQEPVEDVIIIVYVFSCRLYGLRKYKNKLKNNSDLIGGADIDKNSKGKTLPQRTHEKGSRQS